MTIKGLTMRKVRNRAIAKIFNVDESLISHIKRKKKWV